MAADPADGARADRLRAALAWSDRLAADSDAVLERYGNDVARLAALVAPTVERTQVSRGRGAEAAAGYGPRGSPRPALTPTPPLQTLRAARDEVQAAVATAELALHHLDAARRLEPLVLAGPEGDLTSFLDALSRLDNAIAFLKAHAGLAGADAARESAAALRADGGALALRNFETLLRLHSTGDGKERPVVGGGSWGGAGDAYWSRSRRAPRSPGEARVGGSIFLGGARRRPPRGAHSAHHCRPCGGDLAAPHPQSPPRCQTRSSRACACWLTPSCAPATTRASR